MPWQRPPRGLALAAAVCRIRADDVEELRAGRSGRQRDAVLCFKLDNRRLALALEESGSSSPYQAEHYGWWHSLLRAVLEQIPGLTDGDFTAHALLAATRADLVEHLAGEDRVPRETMRTWLANFATRVLASGPLQG